MEHFKQTESFMGLDDFDLPILAGTESDPVMSSGMNQIGRQFMDCSGGKCHLDTSRYAGLGAMGGTGVNYAAGGQYGGLREPYRNDYGMMNIQQESPQFGASGGFGNGGVGGIRQDIGQAMRPGFGRNVGNFYDRPTRRQFNREFQRGVYTGTPTVPCSTGYCYEKNMPNSYYPNRHSEMNPYSTNYDPYPYQQQQQPAQPPIYNTGTSGSYGGNGSNGGGNVPVVPVENFTMPAIGAMGIDQIPGMPWIPVVLAVLFIVLLWNCDDFSKFFRF